MTRIPELPGFSDSEHEDLTCAICSAVATDPMKHEACQKLFCRECLEKHGEDKPCAYCKIEGSMYYESKLINKGEHSLDLIFFSPKSHNFLVPLDPTNLFRASILT